jgi:hypothetical protein
MNITLSILVLDWMRAKKFPFNYYESNNKNIVWCDLDGTVGESYRAVSAIINDPPYVSMIGRDSRPFEYYIPADPEFFDKIEKAINGMLKVEKMNYLTAEENGH